jgi:hypothetical protein
MSVHSANELGRSSSPPGDPLRRAARRFHPEARLWIRDRLQEDRSGRLLDLARVCPGALLFAAGLEMRGARFRDLSHEVLNRISAGAPVGRILAAASAAFLRMESAELDHASVCVGAVPVLPSNQIAGHPVGSQDVFRLRLLIRRASPHVDPKDLVAWPPPFVPEDMPNGPRNPRWYAAIHLAAECWLEHPVPDEGWSFLSKHAADLAEVAAQVAGPSRTPETARSAGRDLARAALRWCSATGRWPSRRTLLWPFIHALLAWWDGQSALPLPPLPVPLPVVPDVELRPLATGAELQKLGGRMHNCLASYPERLRAGKGRRFIFAGTIDGTSVAVDVGMSGSRYIVTEALGVSNAQISLRQRQLLASWLRRLNASGIRTVKRVGDDDCSGTQLRMGW